MLIVLLSVPMCFTNISFLVEVNNSVYRVYMDFDFYFMDSFVVGILFSLFLAIMEVL